MIKELKITRLPGINEHHRFTVHIFFVQSYIPVKFIVILILIKMP